MIGKLLCWLGRHQPKPVGRYTVVGTQVIGILGCARYCGWSASERVDWKEWERWNRNR